MVRIATTSKFKNSANWVKNSFCNINCNIKHFELDDTVLYIGHHNYIGIYCNQLCQKFLDQWRKKAYFHYYEAEGADQLEFIETEQEVSDLCSEYLSYNIVYWEQLDLD